MFTAARTVVLLGKNVNATVSSVASSGSSIASMSTKVTVLGAGGGIGQPLSLLLKVSPHIDELACYDIVGTPGIAADLSHIPTKAKVAGHLPSPGAWPPRGNESLGEALRGSSVVVIPAGVPRKPGMTRDDLFNTNANIVKGLVEECAKHCPDAFLAIISNPVNSTVPISAQVLKKHGVYNPRKLAGVTTLDVLRANTFYAEHVGVDPATINVPVIGGHAGETIMPLFSQVPGFNLKDDEWLKLIYRTQFGGDEVVNAKAGAGSATLSMAYAGFLFAENIVKALKGDTSIVQCAYVESSITDASFFASPCKFGPNGIEEVLSYGDLAPIEMQKLEIGLPQLKNQIKKGYDF